MNRRLEIADYEPIFSARAGWRRIYPDLPGMGLSVAKRIANQDDMLAALLAFIDRACPASASCWRARRSAPISPAASRCACGRAVDGLLLRVPAIIPDTAKRTLPAFEPLVRDEALVASLDEQERQRSGQRAGQGAGLSRRAAPQDPYAGPAGDRRPTRRSFSEMRADPARYGFLLRSCCCRKILRQADPDRRRPARHDRRLPRRLGDPRELPARDLRRDRPGRPWLARRIAGFACRPG